MRGTPTAAGHVRLHRRRAVLRAGPQVLYAVGLHSQVRDRLTSRRRRSKRGGRHAVLGPGLGRRQRRPRHGLEGQRRRAPARPDAARPTARPVNTTISGTPTTSARRRSRSGWATPTGSCPTARRRGSSRWPSSRRSRPRRPRQAPNRHRRPAVSATPATATGGLAPYTWSRGERHDSVRSDARSRNGRARGQAHGGRVVRVLASRHRMPAGVPPPQMPDDGRAGARPRHDASCAPATVGDVLQGDVARGRWAGAALVRVTGGKLPSGLKLNAKTGVISGKPKAAGTFRFRVTVEGRARPALVRALDALRSRVVLALAGNLPAPCARLCSDGEPATCANDARRDARDGRRRRARAARAAGERRGLRGARRAPRRAAAPLPASRAAARERRARRVQETLTAAWRGLPGLRRADRFWPWLVGIASHKAADVHRRRGRDRRHGERRRVA